MGGKVANLPVNKLFGAVQDKVPVCCHAMGKDSEATYANVALIIEKYGNKALKVGVC